MKIISKNLAVAVLAMTTVATSASMALASSTQAAATSHTSSARVSQASNHAARPETRTATNHAIPAASCSGAELCFWVDSDRHGNGGALKGSNNWWGDFPDQECFWPHAAPDAHGTWNDCASSLWNYENSFAVVWQNVNYSGGAYCFPPNTGSADLATIDYRQNGRPIPVSLNDSISSNSWTDEYQCGLIDNG